MKTVTFNWNRKKYTISENQPPLIIAEAGVNHNGSEKLAYELVNLAKESGADFVKFQTFHPREMATLGGPSPEYIKRESPQADSFYKLLEKLTLPDEVFGKLLNYCKKRNIIFLSTPYDNSSADLLDKIGAPMFKIASTDTNNIPLIQYVAKKGKPMIVSTGLSTMTEVREAVYACRRVGNNQVILLQCTSNYPASLEGANIKVIDTYRKKLKVLAGYSDQTIGEIAAILAVAEGAVILEKHFTKDKNLPGPDQRASADIAEMRRYIKAVRDAYIALGDGNKRIMPEEKSTKTRMQKSLTVIRTMKKGEIITKNDILIRRPATGITPKRLNEVIGKKAAQDIQRDMPIRVKDVKW